ncbi:hypothetical protein SynWH8103_00388 [Synechococcus sp. WH 8103]|nr:hypothetical protein SynWH8103_00388 [Synechococcus sp. WH 8103]
MLWTRNNAWPRLQTGNRDLLLCFVLEQMQQKAFQLIQSHRAPRLRFKNLR